MKSRSSTLALFVAILLFTAAVTPAFAQAPSPAAPRLVTVSGEAQVNVVPDEVVLTLGVETSDPVLRNARSLNDQRVGKLIAAAKQFGIDAKDIRTDHIGIEPRYRSSYEQRDFVGYFVRQTIVLTLKDVAKFEDLLTAVLDAGANYVHGVQFRTTDLRKYRDQARSLAMKAAKEKAAALAGELGQTIGKPHSIQEDQSGWWSAYNSWWAGSGASMTQNVIQSSGQPPADLEGSLAPGEISVTAKVTVSFEME